MNKRILKNVTLSVLLAVFVSLSCIGLVGCYNGLFFDKENLQYHLVPDLPAPTVDSLQYRGSKIEVKMTQEQFDNYVVSVYEYLLSCNFVKFGTRGERESSMYGSTYKVNEDVNELSDFYVKDNIVGVVSPRMYVFVWANERGKWYESDNIERWLSHSLILHLDQYMDNTVYMELCHGLDRYDFEE